MTIAMATETDQPIIFRGLVVCALVFVRVRLAVKEAMALLFQDPVALSMAASFLRDNIFVKNEACL